MIDPANVEMVALNDLDGNTIHLDVVPEYDGSVYDLNSEKGYNKFISDVEREVRGSFEYKRLISYLKSYKGMNRCAYMENTTINPDSKVTIEIHHHPFTLYDICTIVATKRLYYGQPMDLEMVAKEVMQLHYEDKIGLIPLSKTPHELYHNGFLQIPLRAVYGNWRVFRNEYWDFFSDEQKDLIERIIQFDKDYDKIQATKILQQKNVYIQSTLPEYALPDLHPLADRIVDRINTIKQNHYQLPSVSDEEYNGQKLLVQKKQEAEEERRRNMVCPITLYDEEGNPI